LITLVNV
jgi:hypothetical protein